MIYRYVNVLSIDYLHEFVFPVTGFFEAPSGYAKSFVWCRIC
jgi:hypothetical protein